MHYQLAHCRNCDLLYASSAPDAGWLAGAYAEAEFDSAVEAHYAARTYRSLVKPKLTRLPDLERALDIGTGDGAFLEEMLKAGFREVEGVEPSAAPIRAASPVVREKIRNEIFAPERFPKKAYSLITCFQTLEHVSDPKATVAGIFELLKPGGMLFVVVHNRSSVVNRLLGKRSPIYDIEHLQLFSPPSIRKLLGESQYIDISVSPFMNVYPLGYWLRLAPISAGIKGSVSRLLHRANLASLPIPGPVGNLAAFSFRPSNG